MIVRNEANVITGLFDSMLPHITTWVIVDTGSTDGTQELIRSYFATRGIPGVLYERPWRNFAENRTEALQLAQGHADYIWQMDADDLLVGNPNLTNLTADSYSVLAKTGNIEFWRRHIFRDGVPWRWVGVLHEYSTCDEPFTHARLEGDCWLEGRGGGARSQDPEKFLRDAEILLAEVLRNPGDARSVFYLAQSYRDYGDLRSARQWYARRAEMGDWPEEVFYSLLQVAKCMAGLNEPWPMVEHAYLKAWAYRPTRAEPLCEIASYYRSQREWQLGYFFAERAAQIPLPDDSLFVTTSAYTITAHDEQGICAYWIGKKQESFEVFHQLLARDDLPDPVRQRIVTNRDYAVPAMLEVTREYPEETVRGLAGCVPGDRDVTVTLTAGRGDRTVTEATLNSLLHICSDIHEVGRFLLFDGGLSKADRVHLADRYPFLEFKRARNAGLADIHSAVDSRFWLHLGTGWQFFAPERLISRLVAILEAEPTASQVGVNLNDATEPGNASATQAVVRSSPATGRYTARDTPIGGPAMYETTRYCPAEPVSGGAVTLAEVIAAKIDGELAQS